MNLSIPEPLLREVQEIATAVDRTAPDVARRLILAGLRAYRIDGNLTAIDDNPTPRRFRLVPPHGR